MAISMPEEFGVLIARELEDKILELGADRVASFSAEPVQGAGGLIFPPATYWPEVQRICAKYDVLLHLDEVITGFGRTGEWFGCADLRHRSPTSSPWRRGCPPATSRSARSRWARAWRDTILNANEELVHGYTYSGHPVASAVALKNLEVMESARAGAAGEGPASVRICSAACGRASTTIRLSARCAGMGLLAAIELVRDKQPRVFFPEMGKVGAHCRNYCFKSGLISRAIRDTMVLSPPLTMSEGEIDEIVSKLKAAIDRTAHDFGIV